MGSTLTTFDALLKERYIDSSKVEELVYPENVFLEKLTKRTDFYGDIAPVPIVTGNPQGLGGLFSKAQTNASNIKAGKWAVQTGEYYGAVEIGDRVMRASAQNAGAFLQDKVLEIDGLYTQMAENLSVYTWGNGGQALGRRSTAATNDITLVSPTDAQNFEVGMAVVASSADGSSAADTLRAGTSTTVAGVNRATGVITLTTASNITGFADGDFLFRESDFYGTTGTIVVRGVQSFIPATDVPLDLWGVTAATRLTDVQRWSGCRPLATDVLGLPIEERIKKLLALMMGRFKSQAPTAGFMHPEDFQTLETAMTARGLRPLEEDDTKFGFAKISIATAMGNIPIYTDRHCPLGSFFAMRMENWWMWSLGELFSPQNGDGLQMLRRDASTDYEFRLISYPALVCNQPKNTGRVSLV